MTAAIEFDSVTKKFGAVTALDELTMQVPAGDVHGFLDPNEAGKSTAIRALLGLCTQNPENDHTDENG